MRLALAGLLLATGCATTTPGSPVDVLLLGEQHDAQQHAQLQEQRLLALVRQGRLAALALEMADRDTSTAGLPATATDAQVRAALQWNEHAWPWERYRAPVMAAVRAGAPVAGANLPRAQMRGAMNDAALDGRLPAAALRAQQDAIRAGHCGLIPEARIPGMTRVQVARDVAMAEVITRLAQPGKTVVLLAGAGHVDPQRGVPLHLPAGLRFQPVVLPAVDTGTDDCAQMREQVRPRAS